MARPSKSQMEAFIRNHPGFESMHWEDDGCFQKNGVDVPGLWVYLKPGWFTNLECGTSHEATLSECYREVKAATYDLSSWLAENYPRVIGGEFSCGHEGNGCCFNCRHARAA